MLRDPCDSSSSPPPTQEQAAQLDEDPAVALPDSSDETVEKIFWTYVGKVIPGPWYLPGSKLRHGRGVCTYTINGVKYDGEWQNDKKSGHGVSTRPSGARYEGEWKHGMQSGHGVYTFPDGQRCEGVWKNSMLSGPGVYTWPDGKRYDGEWKDDKKFGRGVYTWPDGQRYEGEWREDKKSGKGIYTWPSGMRYEGEFKDDLRTGRGVLWHPGGRVFDGIFAGGNPLQGTLMETDGALFHAIFAGKSLQGVASLALAECTPAGRIASGGQPPQGGDGGSAEEWRARVEIPGGIVVEGVFCGLRPNGQATLVEGDGAAYEAEYDGARTLAEGAVPMRKQVLSTAVHVAFEPTDSACIRIRNLAVIQSLLLCDCAHHALPCCPAPRACVHACSLGTDTAEAGRRVRSS
jgi:hypothetical protein